MATYAATATPLRVATFTRGYATQSLTAPTPPKRPTSGMLYPPRRASK